MASGHWLRQRRKSLYSAWNYAVCRSSPYVVFLLSFRPKLNSFHCCRSFSDDEKEDGEEVGGGGGPSDKVSLYKGDITVLEVDAIVNAGKNPTSVVWQRFLRTACSVHYAWLPSAVHIGEAQVGVKRRGKTLPLLLSLNLSLIGSYCIHLKWEWVFDTWRFEGLVAEQHWVK